MIRGFYAAASGMQVQQNNLNTIANNMANVSTTAFKPQQTSFADMLYETTKAPLGTVSYGSGVKTNGVVTNFVQGDLTKTDIEKDCALMGPGFFAVQDKLSGTVFYTRDGSFKTGMEASSSYLVNAAGDYVLDAAKAKISLAKDPVTGMGAYDPSKIGIFNIPNIYALKQVGGNKYSAGEDAGTVEKSLNTTIHPGYLESSAVDISIEMVKVIEASKAFSFNSRIIQTADEIEKTINQLR
ncbi:MAG: flagellar hook-basal body protein [Eubacteriales bacterium]